MLFLQRLGGNQRLDAISNVSRLHLIAEELEDVCGLSASSESYDEQNVLSLYFFFGLVSLYHQSLQLQNVNSHDKFLEGCQTIVFLIYTLRVLQSVQKLIQVMVRDLIFLKK